MIDMFIIGITGSMATGKSELVSRIRSLLHWPVWDADAEIQKLYLEPQIIDAVAEVFPETKASQEKTIDRSKLRQRVITDSSALQTLEDILYPPLIERRTFFIESMGRLNRQVIVLDIPLLFEKGMQGLCDVTVVTICPPWLQQQRILNRPGMAPQLMKHLLSHQLPLATKKQLADIVVETGLNRRHSWDSFTTQINTYIEDNKEQPCAR
jgi:dephospho-CoA kinase